MTISSAIKRLQILEDQHGGETKIELFDDDGYKVTEDMLIIDVMPWRPRPKVCGIMPQSFWEAHAPRGVNFKDT